MEAEDLAPALVHTLAALDIPAQLYPDRLEWVEYRHDEGLRKAQKRPVDAETAMRVLRSASLK
ncbi:hypothetical protein [Salininema proteolyticum]|uniref:Uncharacterized protein n=1 Tax=Salininema proteolyticum TaxID=1607685 RepID=A0ABV8TVM4_9ACTN